MPGVALASWLADVLRRQRRQWRGRRASLGLAVQAAKKEAPAPLKRLIAARVEILGAGARSNCCMCRSGESLRPSCAASAPPRAGSPARARDVCPESPKSASRGAVSWAVLVDRGDRAGLDIFFFAMSSPPPHRSQPLCLSCMPGRRRKSSAAAQALAHKARWLHPCPRAGASIQLSAASQSATTLLLLRNSARGLEHRPRRCRGCPG